MNNKLIIEEDTTLNKLDITNINLIVVKNNKSLTILSFKNNSDFEIENYGFVNINLNMIEEEKSIKINNINLSEKSEFNCFISSKRTSIDVNIKSINNSPKTSSKIILKSFGEKLNNISLVGKAITPKNIKNSNCYIDCSILLNEDFTGNVSCIPILDIANGETTGYHKGSISDMPKELLDFLSNRNISKEQAHKLLINGFLTSPN